MHDFITEELANPASTYAVVDQLDVQLFFELAETYEQLMNNFKAEELANTPWTYDGVLARCTVINCVGRDGRAAYE